MSHPDILNFVQNRVPFSITYKFLEELENAKKEGRDPVRPNIGAGGLVAAEMPLLHKDSPFEVNMFGVSMGNAEIDVLKGYNKELLEFYNKKWAEDSPFIKITPGNDDNEDTKKFLGIEFEENKYNQQLIFMDEALREGYYKKFANEFLWPLMHLTNEKLYETEYKHFPKPLLNDSGYTSYRATNQIFAEAMLKNRIENDDKLKGSTQMFDWAHDYHLMLFPALYRNLLDDNNFDASSKNQKHHIGMFWHIPFFNMDTVRDLIIDDEKKTETQRKLYNPSAKSMKNVLQELTYGMLGSHSIMFHHPEYVNNFANAVNELHPQSNVTSGPYGSKTIHHPMGETLLTAYTIGVPFDKIAKS
ncbi:MAG: trehalose-6-phosphate synthase, partial [Nanobdellota archaeon]